ncbi:MAG: endonuclease domain-containing protein [Ignavibacteriota bacterium]
MLEQFNNRKTLKVKRRSLRNNPTRAEKEMWHGLRNHRSGYKFRRQQSLGPFIVDFYLPEYKLAVEVDGASHDDAEQKKYDDDRTQYLQCNGIELIRFTDGEVLYSVDLCVEKILARIEEMGRGSTTP